MGSRDGAVPKSSSSVTSGCLTVAFFWRALTNVRRRWIPLSGTLVGAFVSVLVATFQRSPPGPPATPLPQKLHTNVGMCVLNATRDSTLLVHGFRLVAMGFFFAQKFSRDRGCGFSLFFVTLTNRPVNHEKKNRLRMHLLCKTSTLCIQTCLGLSDSSLHGDHTNTTKLDVLISQSTSKEKICGFIEAPLMKDAIGLPCRTNPKPRRRSRNCSSETLSAPCDG